jgi:hypothetical protein
LFPTNKIQFHVNLVNKEKSPKYKTNSKEFAELIDINETFYFPNIFKNDLDYCQLLITVYTKEKFGADKLLLQANYSLSSLNLNEQFNYTTLYLEVCTNYLLFYLFNYMYIYSNYFNISAFLRI